MMDVSDGLALDARRLAAASGVTIALDSTALGDDVAGALAGGEDHALLATFPAGVDLPPGFRVIGGVSRPARTVLVDGRRRRSTSTAGILSRLGLARRLIRRYAGGAGRIHHSVVSPYFLSRTSSSPPGRAGAPDREARSTITVACGERLGTSSARASVISASSRS